MCLVLIIEYRTGITFIVILYYRFINRLPFQDKVCNGIWSMFTLGEDGLFL